MHSLFYLSPGQTVSPAVMHYEPAPLGQMTMMPAPPPAVLVQQVMMAPPHQMPQMVSLVPASMATPSLAQYAPQQELLTPLSTVLGVDVQTTVSGVEVQTVSGVDVQTVSGVDVQTVSGVEVQTTVSGVDVQTAPSEPDASPPKAEAADAVPKPAITLVALRDPVVKNNVMYTVPVERLIPTRGLASYLEGMNGKKLYNPSVCLVFLRGRCRHGARCKAFHITRDRVAQLRAEHSVEFDESFLREVPVRIDGHVTVPIRYGLLWRTAGLEAVRDAAARGERLTPAERCHVYVTTRRCKLGERCPQIHVRKLSEGMTRRTPCCYHHGADPVSADSLQETIPLLCGDVVHRVPLTRVAKTQGLAVFNGKQAPLIGDVCSAHFDGHLCNGMDCTGMHICRVWWEQEGLAPTLTRTRK